MKRLSMGVTVMALLLASGASEASTITISYNVNAPGGCSDTSSGPTYSATCTAAGVTTTVAADASLDVMKLYLESGGTFPVGGFQTTVAKVRVDDTLTVTGGSGSGTLVWNWAFDGTLSASEAFFSSLYLNGGVDGQFVACGDNVAFAAQFCDFPLDASRTVGQTVAVSVPFNFGVPFSVVWELSAATGSGCAAGNNCNNPTTGTGTVDFFNTLRLQPLVVLDGNGLQVGDASALSTSGFNYEVAPAASAVPEPASVGLVGIGVAMAVARSRFRKRT